MERVQKHAEVCHLLQMPERNQRCSIARYGNYEEMKSFGVLQEGKIQQKW
jgi:hypothetical protein